MLQHIYNEARSGQWANADIGLCPCRGGWYLSDVDTWHRCPVHGEGRDHPEDDDDAPPRSEEEQEKVRAEGRKWYLRHLFLSTTLYFRKARKAGLASFEAEVFAAADSTTDPIARAESVLEEARNHWYEVENDLCLGPNLEERLAIQAEEERMERMGYYA